MESTKEEGRLRYRGNIYVPDDDDLRLHIIQEHHDTELAGHPGCVKMFDFLNRQYNWKEMHKNINR